MKRKSKFIISSMVQNDINDVLILENKIQKFPWSKQNFIDALLSSYYSKVIKYNDIIIGFIIAMFAPDVTDILNLGINNNFRRQGLATKILKLCETQSLLLGNNILIIEVCKSNLDAIKFYKFHNFFHIGTRFNYYKCKLKNINYMEDALVMKKLIY
ncbi:Ribosomal-protein-alanine acetyltransferase [Candidatus Kinetoplastibacterium sorsogonicusi]|uniref:Ribosomal-protein-alanine acetyltransferase n=1 Tax=Candidatus Kinetoplastidibacterium kentomonadis TaxID=1576550 RepID=A0A3S7JA96_9PROT|nr:GNAT family N-acetyltransferase [Candidatus Kinetoplastibacterium sorsogonicusi]AWD32576.1 Ribosomal-protein-alanine acetyltransferase [Candidatus Kinetoplastibacterium sorsogonicusi]